MNTRWRPPLNSSGILTVSIDNPGARTQPEYVLTPYEILFSLSLSVNQTSGWSQSKNKAFSVFVVFIVIPDRPAHSWSLHPPAVTPPPQNSALEPERKKPKGVPLQFDINSVGKQVPPYYYFTCTNQSSVKAQVCGVVT